MNCKELGIKECIGCVSFNNYGGDRGYISCSCWIEYYGKRIKSKTDIELKTYIMEEIMPNEYRLRYFGYTIRNLHPDRAYIFDKIMVLI
jgi:hypothetical protein